jgi:hypothetical protein
LAKVASGLSGILLMVASLASTGPSYQTCWIALPSLAMTLIIRLVVRKDSANQIFLSNFLLTKIMARAKLLSPQSRHNFSRACVFST